MKKIKLLYQQIFRRKGLYAFLGQIAPNASILDVGCGNDSSYNIKSCFPNFRYTGIDIGDYNQTKPRLADNYFITTAEDFAETISRLPVHFDAIISSHNLEHCNNREKTLHAMLKIIKPGGRLYLSFPCEESVGFPHRRRTLNYFDDKTHKGLPPNFDDVISSIRDQGFEIEQSIRRYRPPVLSLIGLLQEPFACARNDILQGTWALYGFESIIWARRSV
jgi:SAM-dependent methyltransferase